MQAQLSVVREDRQQIHSRTPRGELHRRGEVAIVQGSEGVLLLLHAYIAVVSAGEYQCVKVKVSLGALSFYLCELDGWRH